MDTYPWKLKFRGSAVNPECVVSLLWNTEHGGGNIILPIQLLTTSEELNLRLKREIEGMRRESKEERRELRDEIQDLRKSIFVASSLGTF